jgi:signal transduction histidine kinase/CHASE3 domain sensor protein
MSKASRFCWGIVISLLLVVPTVTLSIYSFRQLEVSTRKVSDTQRSLLDAGNALSTLKDAEIGQRGFLLTGDAAYLVPYQSAILSLPKDLARLSLLPKTSASVDLIEGLRPLVTSKLLEMSEVLTLYQSGEPEKALGALKSGQGKALMDSIRVKIGMFIEHQSALLVEIDEQLKTDLKRMFMVIVVAGTVWMIFLLGFISLLYRQFEGRVSARVNSQVHLQTVELLNAQNQTVERLEVTNTALNDSSVLVETVLNSVTDCVIRARADNLQMEYTNFAANRVFGYESNALINHPVSLILPHLLADVSPFLMGEHEVIGQRRDGSALILKMSLRSMVQSDRQYLIFTLRDFTASKLVETALKTSELNLNNGVAVAGLGLGVIDYVRNEITLDQTSASLFDLPVSKPMSRSEVHGRFHPEDEAAVSLKMAEAMDPSSRGFMAIEHRVVRGDGSVRWLSARKQVVFASNPAGELVPISGALAVRDISGMKSIVLELARAKEVAEGANLAKSRFLSNMSHELRTPLNAILGFAQLMATGNPPPNVKQQKSIDQILQAGWYLLELINEVLDLALIESGKLTLSSEPCDLASILTECQTMMEPQGKIRDVLLVFRLPESPYLLHADRTRLKQVLLNLLSNAIKYNRTEGTVMVSCAAKDKNTVRITVADTGEGLSQAKLDQLFQAFNRLGQEALSEEGTGIGLVLSKRLMELMGGSIGAESTVGIGSQFWIEIGLIEPPPILAKDAAPSSTTMPGQFPLTTKSTLTNRSKEAP